MAAAKYADIINMDGPEYDEVFVRRHPRMLNRAKIFAPFAALAGFDDAIRAKEVQYVPKEILDPEDEAELNTTLLELRAMTISGKAARENKIQASVRRFIICEDPCNDAFGRLGRYETVTGMVWRVDAITQQLLIDDQRIPFADISEITVAALQAVAC